jgi:hypothetical protein
LAATARWRLAATGRAEARASIAFVASMAAIFCVFEHRRGDECAIARRTAL